VTREEVAQRTQPKRTRPGFGWGVVLSPRRWILGDALSTSAFDLYLLAVADLARFVRPSA